MNRVGSGGVILIVRDKVVRCIRQIEGLRAKLQLKAFRQSKILEDRKIKMPEGRAVQAVTSRVSDFINGEFLNGAQTEVEFEKIIELELTISRDQTSMRASR